APLRDGPVARGPRLSTALPELLIAAGPGEWRAALVEEGAAVELFVERGAPEAAGSIHLGRVRRRVPALAAVQVEIGGERPVFLPQSEILPRGATLDEGARALVQIRREAQGGKAALATTAIRLRGRHVELLVGRPGLFGAEKLPADERDRLSEALTHPAPQKIPGRAGSPLSRIAGEGGPGPAPAGEAGEGMVGFTLLEPAPIDALIAEAARLEERWREIRDRAARSEPPCRLDPPAGFAAALAARLPPPRVITVDDPAALPEIRAAFPEAEAVHGPEASWPIDLDSEFERALAPHVALGVGALHIETTRAAVLIDVDSGTPETGSRERTARAVNLAAARAIARHLRLRNIGGGIIVDFVGLEGEGGRGRVRRALAGALAADPAGPQILGWTRLGHLELVRPRRARPLAEILLEPRAGGAWIKTPLTVACEALRALAREERARPGRHWRLAVAGEVATALSGEAAGALAALERRLARPIAVAAAPGQAREHFEILPV
ncbi:MAG TPA: ribonuclease E/G, partial [Stellaceae bacterium]|nr:ribonuclease E/G [Stellaceae bacterium]